MKLSRLIAVILTLFATQIFAQMTISITSPTNKARYDICDDISVKANLTIQSGEVKRVYFYRDGSSLTSFTKEPYEYVWANAPSGIYEISAKVVDKDNNEFFSNSVLIFIGPVDDGEKIKNGEFACGTWPWGNLNVNSAASATWEIEHDGWLSDSTCAFIDIVNGGSADWHIQLHQRVPLDSGHVYQISFMAEALDIKDMSVELQKNQDPWDIYWMENITVTGFGEFGPYEFACEINDPQAYFRFNVGNNTIPIYIDAVSVIDLNWTSVKMIETTSIPNEFELKQNYPNPFNPSTNVQYTVAKSEMVTLSVYNLLGEHVRILVNQNQNAGTYLITWDGRDEQSQKVDSGVYVYKLETEPFVQSKKMLLLK